MCYCTCNCHSCMFPTKQYLSIFYIVVFLAVRFPLKCFIAIHTCHLQYSGFLEYTASNKQIWVIYMNYRNHSRGTLQWYSSQRYFHAFESIENTNKLQFVLNISTVLPVFCQSTQKDRFQSSFEYFVLNFNPMKEILHSIKNI